MGGGLDLTRQRVGALWRSFPQRFLCRGLDLNHPVDAIVPGRYPLLKNVRSYQEGRIEGRPGLTRVGTAVGAIVAGQSPIHSIYRLNDPLNNLFTYVIGTGTHLAYGTTTFTDADSGYSGNPLSMVPWRPEQSPDSWLYIADSSRMRKLRRDGTLHQIGIVQPTVPPTASLLQPQYKLLHDFEATAGWTQGGTAGVPTLLSAGPGYRITTTITAILYDSGVTGWASVQPAATAGIGVGMFLTFNPGGGSAETPVVEKYIPAITNTTIGRILYDSGATGDCAIYLATPSRGLMVNALILINSGGGSAERVRVKELVTGPDGILSIRVTTVNNHVATETITGVPSLRVYLTNNHAVAEVIRTDGMRSALTSGTGTLTRTQAADLSFISSRPVQDDDEIHLSVRLSVLASLTEGKIMFDVDSATNDFTQNYYYYSFRPSDFAAAAAGTLTTLTARQRAAQRKQIDTAVLGIDEPTAPRIPPYLPGVPGLEPPFYLPERVGNETPPAQLEAEVAASAASVQTDLGDNQWMELRFKIGQLIRVGTDRSRTLANVAAIRLSFVVTASINVDMDALWLGGSYGPDIGEVGAPYVYRYQYRVSSTGAKSGFSPPMRSGIEPHRQGVTINATQSSVTEVDKVDYFRFGGVLTDWVYVGSSANGATPSLSDTLADESVAANPSADVDHHQPWLVLDTPKSGTAATVAGTSVTDNATNFNTAWVPGTLIRINGVAYTIYRVISTSLLELFENAGSQASVTWEVPEPALTARSLPILFGPFENVLFGLGDAKNPGRLYYTKGNDPDATRAGYYLDVTPPSEPLMSGCVYKGRAYVYSTERAFALYPTNVEGVSGRIAFRAIEVPNSKGLFSRWGLAVGPRMWFLSKDGIYETTGDEPKDVTLEMLNPLFPREGNAGEAVNGINPPDLVVAQAANLRLSYYDSVLYFDYKDTTGVMRTLLLDTNGWFYDVYTPAAQVHYGAEGQSVHAVLVGSVDGQLYTLAGGTDDSTDFSRQVRTPSHDMGDPRTQKFWGDVMVDVDTAGSSVTATPGINNHSTTFTSTQIQAATRGQGQASVGSTWQLGRNFSLDLTWTKPSVFLYVWEPRWAVEPGEILALSWETPPTTHGFPGFQHIGDCYLAHNSTADLSLVVTVDGVDQAARTIANGGGTYKKSYLRLPVYKGKSFRYRVSSTAAFRLYLQDCELRAKPWGSGGAYTTVRLFGLEEATV